MGQYISVQDRLPELGERVITKYEGVYEDRGAYENTGVEYWVDTSKNNHFGGLEELDGRGSQPATHWKRLRDQGPIECLLLPGLVAVSRGIVRMMRW